MKKLQTALAGLIVSASLLLSLAPVGAETAEPSPYVIDAVVSEGRMLVAIREVSAGLGAEVEWVSAEQIVMVRLGETELRLKIGSRQVMKGNERLEIDVPAQILNGSTYVPIRFISQGLNGSIDYDPSTRSADIRLQDKRVRVITPATHNQSALTQARIDALIAKANEATRLSDFKQIRTHFRPYFTDAYINKLIRQGGPGNNYRFTEQPHTYSDEQTGAITQTSADAVSAGLPIERGLILTWADGTWKVNDIYFKVLYP